MLVMDVPSYDQHPFTVCDSLANSRNIFRQRIQDLRKSNQQYPAKEAAGSPAPEPLA